MWECQPRGRSRRKVTSLITARTGKGPCRRGASFREGVRVEGSPHALEILSDHKNLEVFRHTSKLSYCQARWAEFLSRFSFTIQHISGKKAGKPGALSRRPDHILDHKDNEDCILLPSNLFASSQCVRISISFDNPDLLQRIKDAQQLDTEVLDALRYILARNLRPLILHFVVTGWFKTDLFSAEVVSMSLRTIFSGVILSICSMIFPLLDIPVDIKLMTSFAINSFGLGWVGSSLTML